MKNRIDTIQGIGQKASVAEVAKAIIHPSQRLAVMFLILVEDPHRMTFSEKFIHRV